MQANDVSKSEHVYSMHKNQAVGRGPANEKETGKRDKNNGWAKKNG